MFLCPQLHKSGTLKAVRVAVKGATGTIQFLPTGDHSMKEVLVEVQPSQKPGLDYDFVALQSDRPPMGGGELLP